MKSGIYRILNKVNGKIYVGSAVNIRKRWNVHIRKLKEGTHHNPHLQNSFNKYGVDVFTLDILENIEPKYLIECEQFWIDKLKAVENGYNICPAGGSQLGLKRSNELRMKMSAMMKGKPIWPKGSKFTPEHCAKIAEVKKGFKHSPESKIKIGAAHKGKIVSQETRAKMSAAHKAQWAVPGAKIRVNRPSRKTSITKAKISATLKGYVKTPEHRAKLSTAAKAYWAKRKSENPIADINMYGGV